MATIEVGALAFLGPPHAPSLPEFTYARVQRVSQGVVTVVAVNPDHDEGDAFDVPLAKLRHRIVSNQEAASMPGSYVSHTVAFVQPNGPTAGQWAYGVVTGYRMVDSVPYLDILHRTENVNLRMDDPSRLIKVDYTNYALQVGAGLNCTVTNALELIEMQNEVGRSFKKRRSAAAPTPTGIPTQISHLLNVAFSPDEQVPIIRPSNLTTVWVRRQHLIDTARQSPKQQQGVVFDDPMAVTNAVAVATVATEPVVTRAPTTQQQPGDIDDDISSFLSSARADAEEVRNQNTALRKRQREPSDSSSTTSYHSIDAAPEPRRSRATRTAFHPSATQRAVHALVVHEQRRGKDPQDLLELTQHSSLVVKFLATPPVLRGLYEFGFDGRGLELMHCKRSTQADKISAKEKGMNMTDFSEKNVLKPAPKPKDRVDVTDALRSLKSFGRFFYNRDTNSLIDTAVTFVDEYTAISDDDAVGWNHIALWIAEKFGKYSGLLVCNEQVAARAVVTEFSRHDEALARFNDLRLTARIPTTSQRPRPTTDEGRRPDRQRRVSTVPKPLLEGLPIQSGKTLCMKYLSVAGCTGNGSGGCFDPRRAHFRPASTALRADARAYIADHYQGLSSTFSDL